MYKQRTNGLSYFREQIEYVQGVHNSINIITTMVRDRIEVLCNICRLILIYLSMPMPSLKFIHSLKYVFFSR